MPAELQWVGAEKAMSELVEWSTKVGPKVEHETERKLGPTLRGAIAGKVPVLTGDLKNSVKVTGLGEGHGWQVGMGEGLPYAAWIEYGGARGRERVPDGRYVLPTAIAYTDDFARQANDAATDSVRRFPWTKHKT